MNFPIGVLLYWLTTNVWSMGQQFYVIRRMPAPGSLAEQALMERRRKHGKSPLPGVTPAAELPDTTVPRRSRRPRSASSPSVSRVASDKAVRSVPGRRPAKKRPGAESAGSVESGG